MFWYDSCNLGHLGFSNLVSPIIDFRLYFFETLLDATIVFYKTYIDIDVLGIRYLK